MKKRLLVIALLVAFAASGAMAQNTVAASVKGMSLNGSTGIITVPTGRIGWEMSDFGIDAAYGFIWSENTVPAFAHLPRVSVSFLKRVEVTGLFEFDSAGYKTTVITAKGQLFKEGGAALALGLDLEIPSANYFPNNGVSSKFYVAATYAGNFFDMPAVTTATFGWQYLNVGKFSSQFLYGMGFEMGLFPKAFKDYVYWITDFSNFSYVVQGGGINATYRGAFNTGLRIDVLKSGRFKLVIDFVGTDLLDDGNRGLSATVVFGTGLGR